MKRFHLFFMILPELPSKTPTKAAFLRESLVHLPVFQSIPCFFCSFGSCWGRLGPSTKTEKYKTQWTIYGCHTFRGLIAGGGIGVYPWSPILNTYIPLWRPLASQILMISPNFSTKGGFNFNTFQNRIISPGIGVNMKQKCLEVSPPSTSWLKTNFWAPKNTNKNTDAADSYQLITKGGMFQQKNTELWQVTTFLLWSLTL